LLKPISTDRFLRAINKLFAMQSVTKDQEPSMDFLFARAGGGLVKVNHADILYLEGLENYVRIYTKDRMILCLSTLKSIEDSLPSRFFLRIHRCHIVNLSKVEMVQKHSFRVGNKSLAVGKSYRKTVSDVLKKYLPST
jgi:two-component system, LytTR family, response regulator